MTWVLLSLEGFSPSMSLACVLWLKRKLTANRKDAFVRREAAHEGMYIRSHEAEKLEALRKKMKGQREQLEELEQHV